METNFAFRQGSDRILISNIDLLRIEIDFVNDKTAQEWLTRKYHIHRSAKLESNTIVHHEHAHTHKFREFFRLWQLSLSTDNCR